MKILKTLSTHILRLLIIASFSTFAIAAESQFISNSSDFDPSKLIKLNQIGYKPNAPKVAVIPNVAAEQFAVLDAASLQIVFTAKLSSPKYWPYSDEMVKKADFSAFNKVGYYRLSVDGIATSHTFEISQTALLSVHNAAIKAYYFNRAGMLITEEFAGLHARAAGHIDTQIKVHQSAKTKNRPEGTLLISEKGWYDAGDYGKYVVNSGISTYTLLMSYIHNSEFYASLNLAIPESADQIPDLINEIKWNLDWLETMQDEDGGVYHKLTAKQFSQMTASPKLESKPRYMIGKSLTATLDFAAVMAVASRVMSDFDDHFPGLSVRYQERAMQAYQWAKINPEALYKQPEDVATGAYSDDNADDEFAWAAAELFIATEDQMYLSDFYAYEVSASDSLTWSKVGALAYISLTTSAQKILNDDEFKTLESRVLIAAQKHLKIYTDSAYGVAISKADFVWGSNGGVLNNGIVLMQAYRLSGDAKYLEAALSTINYVFGQNATGYSFVTGHGDKTPVNIHHRPSTSDNTDIPVPGFLAGGPHSGQQDNCHYPSSKPALSYVDTVCSYSTNEVAINWNAPLVYMLAAAVNAQF